MAPWFLMAVLAGSPADSVAAVTDVELLQHLAKQVQTGSLIFSQGDCLAVKAFSGSRFTHVAAIVVTDNQATVYESHNRLGVHRLPLAEYLAKQGGTRIEVLHPSSPLTDEQQAQFQDQLDQNLGRPYAVAHHLTGERAKGIHCAELVTDALVSANLIRVRSAPKVSPGSLELCLQNHSRYAKPASYTVLESAPPLKPVPQTWCSRAWDNTVTVAGYCGVKFNRCVLCR